MIRKGCEMMRRAYLPTVLILLALAGSASACTWRVPSECPTLKAGCDSASYGDTVLVEPGTYVRTSDDPETWWGFKPGLTVLSEFGPEVTIIEMCGLSVAVGTESEGSRFSGFTVRFGTGPDCEYPPCPTEGVSVYNCTDVIVENCIIENVSYGIYVEGVSGSWYKPVFRNNIIRNCAMGIAVRRVIDPGRPYFEGNTITNCNRGVEVTDSSPLLADNIVMNCRTGLCYKGRCGGNVKRSVIADNIEDGVQIIEADHPLAVPDFNGGLSTPDANDFYGNGRYDINYCYDDVGGVMAKQNWWGADCPDFTGKFKGLVYYSPWVDSTHTLVLREEDCAVATESSTWGRVKAMFR
jgi:parallel beta-helix repeat protein